MSDIVKRLRAANTTLNEGDCCGQLDASGTCTAPACIFGEALKMTHDAADEIERLRKAYSLTQDAVQQTLGRALGYPWFKDDQHNFPGATEADGVCVGDHVAESIADETAAKIAALQAALRAELDDHEEAIKHDRGGLEYASLVGIPLSNADSLAQSVRYHERRAKLIRAALGGEE